jgi:predicted kinase
MRAPAPVLIIVGGLPATGKTTLGSWIAREFRLPFFQKDGFKETLFSTLGWKDRAWSQQLSLASNALLIYTAAAVLAAGQAVIVESNHPAGAAPQLRALIDSYGARALQIHCRAQPDTLWERFVTRTGQRHPGHTDQLYLEEFRQLLRAPQPEALDLGAELIEVDTTDFQAIDYTRLREAVQVILSPEGSSR